jgi:hypothetical protein
VTGIYFQQTELAGKRLQLMKEALPNLRAATVFWDHWLKARHWRDIASFWRDRARPTRPRRRSTPGLRVGLPRPAEGQQPKLSCAAKLSRLPGGSFWGRPMTRTWTTFDIAIVVAVVLLLVVVFAG